MARVLVLGAAGMLGHKVCQELNRRQHEVVALTRAYNPALSLVTPETRIQTGFDVLAQDSLEKFIAPLRADFLVNAIGIVKQLGEASDKFLCTAINAWLPHRLARFCQATGSRLIHISTDCVFNGARGRYTEEDPSDAEDLYGKSKWLGETDIKETSAVTLRTSIIGRELKPATHGLLEWFLAQKGKHIKGFSRAIYTGFTTHEMARVISLVIESGKPLHGLLHVASDPISKYDLLSLIKAHSHLEVDISRDEELICDRSLIMKPFSTALGYHAPSWKTMVSEMCADPTPYDRIRSEFL